MWECTWNGGNDKTGEEMITVQCGPCTGRNGDRSYGSTQHQGKLGKWELARLRQCEEMLV